MLDSSLYWPLWLMLLCFSLCVVCILYKECLAEGLTPLWLTLQCSGWFIIWHQPDTEASANMYLLIVNGPINTQYSRNSTIVYPLNMEYGWKFWLKGFMYTHHKLFFEISPCAKHVIFISEFDNFGKNHPLYDKKNIFLISACAYRNFKNIFSRPLFIIIFGQKW